MGSYHAFDDLQMLTTAAKVPKTEEQLINYGLETIQKLEILKKVSPIGLKNHWNNKHGPTLKKYFNEAHLSLQKIRGKNPKYPIPSRKLRGSRIQ